MRISLLFFFISITRIFYAANYLQQYLNAWYDAPIRNTDSPWKVNLERLGSAWHATIMSKFQSCCNAARSCSIDDIGRLTTPWILKCKIFLNEARLLRWTELTLLIIYGTFKKEGDENSIEGTLSINLIWLLNHTPFVCSQFCLILHLLYSSVLFQ